MAAVRDFIRHHYRHFNAAALIDFFEQNRSNWFGVARIDSVCCTKLASPFEFAIIKIDSNNRCCAGKTCPCDCGVSNSATTKDCNTASTLYFTRQH